MNKLYALMGCPICNIQSMAVQIFNTIAPPDKIITIIDVLPQDINGKAIGDARLSFMAELNKNPSIEEWGFPVMILEDLGMIYRSGRVMKGNNGSILIHSAYSVSHTVEFLREYLVV